MYNHRFTCYIIALVAICVSGVGYRIYTDHVEFERNSVDAFVDQGSIDKDAAFLAGGGEGRTPAESSTPGATIGETGKNGSTPQSPVKVRYAPVGGLPIKEEDIELVSVKTFSVEELMPQFVETPDGKIHKVLRPPGEEYRIRPGTFMAPSELEYARVKVTIDGVTYNVPEGEDADSYINKIHLSSMYDVPIEDVGRLITEGLIPNSPIEAGKLFDGDSLQAPIRADSAAREGVFEGAPTPSEVSPVMDESKSPVPPAHVHHEDGHVHHGEKHTDEPPTAESIETQLKERLSPERFSKAKQLFDQYGTEEGLRRLRESDPDAARQFERHPPISPRKQGESRKPAREVPGKTESSTQ